MDTKQARKAVTDRLTKLGYELLPAGVIDILVTTAEEKAQKARDEAVTRQAVSAAFSKYSKGLEEQEKAGGAAASKAGSSAAPKAAPAK